MATKAQYQSYNDVLDKGKQHAEMTYREKKKLIQQIDRLDTKDHIGILRIIIDATTKKIYTVNNYGTYIDLDDLDNQTLWKISYFVSLCLENLEREKEKEIAEKKHLEKISQLDNNLKNKLKLTPQNLQAKSKDDDDDNSDDNEDSEDSSLSPDNMVTSKARNDDSEFPGEMNFDTVDLEEFDDDNQDDDDDEF